MSDETTVSAHTAANKLFDQHESIFGRDLLPYRHHVHRVLGLVSLQVEVEPQLVRPLGVAAFFHDASIWFDQTWDYLPGSIERAIAELGPDEQEHAGLVTALVDEHHRIRKARHPHPLVEAFRRADMADIYSPLVGAPGVRRSEYRKLVDEYPYKGFRRMLAKAFGRGLRESPLRPMPMVKF
ncbi:MAG: hypothetical protein GXP35_00965 [Actinobacteria bacterium]|nr:hypothetical protein [Actinomycetota bacterium]